MALLRAIHGQIKVNSKPGLGTTFRVYLPVTDGEMETDSLPVGEMDLKGKQKVMAVDDDESIRNLLVQVLTHRGFKVEVFEDGTAAWNGISIDRGSIQLLPWPRAYRIARDIPGSILFSTCLTAERNNLFKRVGPITVAESGLIALKQRNINFQSLEDAKEYIIGTIRDDVPEEVLLNAGLKKSNLDRVSSLESNIKKLQAGRIYMLAFCVPCTRYVMVGMGWGLILMATSLCIP